MSEIRWLNGVYKVLMLTSKGRERKVLPLEPIPENQFTVKIQLLWRKPRK